MDGGTFGVRRVFGEAGERPCRLGTITCAEAGSLGKLGDCAPVFGTHLFLALIVSTYVIFPSFPAFRRLTAGDEQRYVATYRQVEPYADFSFNNLLIWLDMENDLEVSTHGDCLILRFTNVFEGRKSYTMLGVDGCDEAARSVFAFQDRHGIAQELSMVPECATREIRGNAEVVEDPDSSDYVFDIAMALKMSDNSFARLRKENRAFWRRHGGRARLDVIDPSDTASQHLIFNRLDEWRRHGGGLRNDPDDMERRAIERAFSLAAVIGFECVGLWIDGKLVSFAVFHLPPQPGWAIVNHLKYDRGINGLFDATYHAVLGYLADKGLRFINLEQDLGIDGLRFHKNRLRPAGRLKRYTIRSP